ncbi:MAG: acyltransferase [Desulfovibrio sp.]|nr:acyltransferase [Desulfovibrio sp.]
MGLLRFYLALAVCLNHLASALGGSEKLLLIPSSGLAVEIFFAISGFYMAMILGGKYQGPNGLKMFYSNRILRIFPLYLAIIASFSAVGLMVFLVKGHWVFMSEAVEMFRNSGPGMQLFVIWSNLTMIGQNIMFISQYTPSTESFCLGCAADTGSVAPWRMLVIPQAWSVEVELLFYALAPWLIRLRTKTIAGVIILLTAVKIMVTMQVTGTDYWSLRFPGFELSLFLAGILAYRQYKRLENVSIRNSALATATIAMFAYLCVIDMFKSDPLQYMTSPIAVIACLPCMFKAFRKSQLDRGIGELSYPLYLVHYLVMQMVIYWYKGPQKLLFAVTMAVVISFVLYRVVCRPIETYRQLRVRIALTGTSDA